MYRRTTMGGNTSMPNHRSIPNNNRYGNSYVVEEEERDMSSPKKSSAPPEVEPRPPQKSNRKTASHNDMTKETSPVTPPPPPPNSLPPAIALPPRPQWKDAVKLLEMEPHLAYDRKPFFEQYAENVFGPSLKLERIKRMPLHELQSRFNQKKIVVPDLFMHDAKEYEGRQITAITLVAPTNHNASTSQIIKYDELKQYIDQQVQQQVHAFIQNMSSVLADHVKLVMEKHLTLSEPKRKTKETKKAKEEEPEEEEPEEEEEDEVTGPEEEEEEEEEIESPYPSPPPPPVVRTSSRRRQQNRRLRSISRSRSLPRRSLKSSPTPPLSPRRNVTLDRSSPKQPDQPKTEWLKKQIESKEAKSISFWEEKGWNPESLERQCQQLGYQIATKQGSNPNGDTLVFFHPIEDIQEQRKDQRMKQAEQQKLAVDIFANQLAASKSQASSTARVSTPPSSSKKRSASLSRFTSS